MNSRCVFHLVSYLIGFVSLAMGTCALVAWIYGDGWDVIRQILTASGAGLLLGGGLWYVTLGPVNLTRKDGFAIVSFGWMCVGAVGALPYILTGAIPSPVDAIFETISGFTTTGSTILTDIEVLPRGIIFWRSLTQWLGGMGVLLLCVAILPFLGVGGMQIYRAEMPGPSKDRLTPRIGNTAKLLYGVYLLLTVTQILLLMLAGMNVFDAVNHTFCTVSTGGFSPYNNSLAAFDSTWIHSIVIVFMILAGINFSLHFQFLRGRWNVFQRSSETKAYLFLIFGASLLVAWNLWTHQADGSPGIQFRDALFQVVSIITTTGFATADYDLWPLFGKIIIFILLFSGGCAGSTAGGLKVMRSLVLFKEVFRQIKLYMQPQAVLKVRLDRQSVSGNIVSGIMAFAFCYFMLIVLFTLVMTFYLPDLTSAYSAAITCLSNVGPGFSVIGPTQNFASIDDMGKLLLSFCMLLGRLELFTILVLFSPGFWKR
ncbi:potassium transporter TrkG [Kiritimatiellaeota bacterium B1221]|nr:potassium transporter TrkG [Kiritimatiellaeota bacterium B1221]